MTRLGLEEYFLGICDSVSKRGTCDRKLVGAVIVRDKMILSTGYNGSPRGMPHCSDVGCEIEGDHCIRTTHAEANALIQAARHGIKIDKAELFCTMVPCYSCAKLLVNAGICKVTAKEDYHASEKTKKLFKSVFIPLKICKS
uniref:Putative CMP/dCMP deaminase zinc-binding n=1 Tax=viral metagenome TaxID=1070528 RepID=A0A6H1ZI85_9ZZZZ